MCAADVGCRRIFMAALLATTVIAGCSRNYDRTDSLPFDSQNKQLLTEIHLSKDGNYRIGLVANPYEETFEFTPLFVNESNQDITLVGIESSCDCFESNLPMRVERNSSKTIVIRIGNQRNPSERLLSRSAILVTDTGKRLEIQFVVDFNKQGE